jgi:NAD(P)-dependent dehydrogenase (short-subunit alcohol dehydrogenase family)
MNKRAEEQSATDQKIALVTGGSKGIGLAIVHDLMAKGYIVYATWSHSEESAGKAEKELALTYAGREFHLLQCNVANKEENAALIEKIFAEHKRLDVLVNNAGVLKQQDVFQLSEEDWDSTFGVNLKGPFFLSQLLMPRMKEQGGGAIVNIASIGGQTGGPKAPDYAASKAALICFTQSMARHGAKMNVRVNAVSPGWIDTGIFSPERAEEIKEEAKVQIPLGRMGTPREVAHAVEFLLSSQASYITGHTLNVNGGLYME